ncbi:MAG: MATE family efflux transporter [Desulfovibrio sp.]|nr:MATE family efflux transporter [Desulfovibrio sp.]
MFASSRIDMLKGSIWDRLILFSLPLALTNVLQQLFNTADVMIVGRFVGRDAMAGVGSMTPVISIFVALFLGLALGANVSIARYFGKKSDDGIRRASHAAFFLAFFLGLFCLFLTYPFLEDILDLVGVPSAISPLSQDYLAYYLLGLPAISFYNFAAAMLRSEGDTTSPFISLFIASVLNIVLNLLAVLVFDLGVKGVALATSFSNAVSAIILFFLLLRRKVFGLRPFFRRIDKNELKTMLAIGLPAAIQGMVFCISNVVVQSAINSLGADVIAGSAAAFTIEINMYCLMSAFAQAATTFVSQNYGARNIARCLRVTKVSLYVTLPLNVCMSLLILFLSPWLLGFFTADPAVFETAMQRIYFIVLPNAVTIFIDILSGSLRGYGCSLPPAIATLLAICGIRIVWVFTVFQTHHTFDWLLASYPLSWFATALFIAIVYWRYWILHLRRASL